MAKDFVTLPIGYKRVDNQPLMSDQVFTELSLAQKFAKDDPTAYVGQILSVVTNEGSTVYFIDSNKTLIPMATADNISNTEIYSLF